MIFIIIIFINYIFYYATCVNYLPRFESLPPPLVYYAENGEEVTRLFECKAWPLSQNTEIKFYSTKRPISTDANDLGQFSKSEPLHPLDIEYIDGHSVVVRTVSQARILSKLDLHCLAKTTFGAVISRPFRVVEARLGAFPSSTSANEARKVVKYFMNGNVAFVDCNPPVSFPPAVIEFSLNGTTIKASQRYKYVKRPNSHRVTLLIQAFEPRDQGYYRCVATNRITGETKLDPLVQQLRIKNPVAKVPVSIKMSIFGREWAEGAVSVGPLDVISVLEGVNVTLFCIMEGAPPPTVTTYKLRSSPSIQHRHISDKEFGLLSIIGVSTEDEDSYLCSESSSSDTAQLKVQRRLSITQGPKDIRVNELGSQARFTCLSNDANITPQWYFNGRIRAQSILAGQDSSLHIPEVRKEDLGVYQCVARSRDEWVTQVASLSLKGEGLLSTDEDAKNGSQTGSLVVDNLHADFRGSRVKKNVDRPRPNDLSSQGELDPPEVSLINDNLAVLLKWRPGDGSSGLVRYYRVQYRSHKASNTEWSSIQTLNDEITDRYFYVTSRHLVARHVFEFRISAVLISTTTRYSQWSREVAFTHIYPVQPLIQSLQTLNASHVRIQWQYTSMMTYPISEFKLLVRKVISEGSRLHYSKFRTFLVANPQATEAILGPLDPGQRYQVVVYGINESNTRKITIYSAEAAFETYKSDVSASSLWPGKTSGESNTRLMFVILGSLAGLMVLVIVVLVLMCYCRERKSVVMHRLNRYKDPAKLIHSSEQAKAVLLASISAPIGKQQTDLNHGEHASLLSTGPDAVYYQQKRQPPSGGSGHDMSDGEGVSMQDQSVMQDSAGMQNHMHPSAGMMTPQPPAITYYKTAAGPASLPAGSLMRQGQQQQFSPQRYSPGFQYAPQIMYTNAGIVYSPGSYLGTMYPQQPMAGPPRQEDLRSQDGGESVYSYFSQTSNNNCQRQMGMQGTVETGSQTMNSNGSAGHRHHRRKRRKTATSGVSEVSELCNGQAKVRGMYPGAQVHGQREVMYDIPPINHHDPRMIGVPPGMVLMQNGLMNNGEQCWGQVNNTLTRRGTPTLFVEPPRIRDYSEYGIPHNQMMVAQPQQLAHLSQQNLHLHNQNLSGGYRDAQA